MSFDSILDEHFEQLALAGELEAIEYIERRTVDGEAVDTTHPIDLAQVKRADLKPSMLGDPTQETHIRLISIRKSDLDAAGISPEEGDLIVLSDESEWAIKSWAERTMKTVFEFTCHQGRM